MLKRLVKVSPQSGVNAGETVLYNFPLDRRYHRLDFRYKGNANRSTIESDIQEIRVYINDVEQRVCSAAQLLDINAIYGRPFQTGFLSMYFSEPWMANLRNENLLGWSMGDVSSFRVEIDLAPGATSPTLEAYAVTDNPVQTDGQNAGQIAPIGNIVKWLRRPIGVTSTGDREVFDLPIGQGVYKAIHAFESSSNDISEMKVQVDQLNIIDRAEDEVLDNYLKEANQEYNPGGPDDDVVSVVFSPHGNAGDFLPMVKANGQPVSDMRVTFNMSAASDFTLLAEIFGSPN